VWPGEEEGGGQTALLEKAEEARDADARPVFASVQHRRRHTVVGKPDRERVEVEAQADGAARHDGMLVQAVPTI
jgi:hypothetical protein